MQTTGLPPVSRGSVPSRASRGSRQSQDEDPRRSRRSRASMESRGSSKHSRRRSIDTAGSVRFVHKEEAVRLMVWDLCTGNEQQLDAVERI